VFDKVMPENHLFGKRAMLPLWCKTINIVVGDPLQLDIAMLKKQAEEAVRNGDNQFGKDAIIEEKDHGKELVAEESVAKEEPGEGKSDSMLKKEDLKSKTDEKKRRIMEAGCEVTRRLYAEISNRIKEDLEKLVFRAHELNKEE
jgi:hypothetical protein